MAKLANSGDGVRDHGGGFSRLVAESDGLEYDVDQAEAKDLQYLVENSCIACDKVLPKYAIRIQPPRYVQERDPYVRNGTVGRRLMCVECYNSMRMAHKSRLRRSPLAQDSRDRLVKGVVSSFLAQR